MLGHVLAVAQRARSRQRVAVVVGPDMDAVRAEALSASAPAAQGLRAGGSQRGTADAVLAAREATRRAMPGDVLVLYADTPLLPAETLAKLLARLDEGAGIAVLGFEAADPTGYGRLLTDGDGWLNAIREDKDASAEERARAAVQFRRHGLPARRSRWACCRASATTTPRANSISPTPSRSRARAGRAPPSSRASEDDVLGVNSREQLAAAEAIFQKRARLAVMREGATLIAPETVWLSYDTKIGRDVIIEPNVFFGPGVTVEDGAEIKANCHFERARIGQGARVGPFARLRPGAVLGADVHVGNFVEVKNVDARRRRQGQPPVLLGDGTVGAGANIGAGTIFCNYDGFIKHRTEVGEGAFVGSNTSLVAPVKIGRRRLHRLGQRHHQERCRRRAGPRALHRRRSARAGRRSSAP